MMFLGEKKIQSGPKDEKSFSCSYQLSMNSSKTVPSSNKFVLSYVDTLNTIKTHIIKMNRFAMLVVLEQVLPCNYQLSKSIVHEIKFGDIAVM